jgi:ribosomal protein S27E
LPHTFKENEMVRIQVFCEHCHHESIVYHLDWTRLVCSNCKSEIENNLYEEYDEDEKE